MPCTAPETIGFGRDCKCTPYWSHRGCDGRANRIGRMPGSGVLILPDGPSGPTGWRVFCRADGPAPPGGRTELSGAVFGTKITPSEFEGDNASELTGFARGSRGGILRSETHVEVGVAWNVSGGAR